MSPEQLNERFRAAASLPPETSLAEATERFLNPVPLLPPARSWYLNPFLMTTVLFALLSTLFALPDTPDEVALTAFRMEVPAPELVPVAPLPRLMVTLKNERTLPAVDASVTSPLLVPSLAPAAAPALAVQKDAPPTLKMSPADTPKATTSTTQPGLPPVILTGQWEYRKKRFYLIPTRKPGHYALGYNIHPSTGETVLLRDGKRRPVSIERAAGTVVLKNGKRNGEFEFVANEMFRRQLNEKGRGDQAYKPEDNPSKELFFNILPNEDLREMENPYDVLWLKYYLADIDEAYVRTLQDFGYTDEELTDLWKLANTRITPSKLAKMLPWFQKHFTDRPPLKYFGELWWSVGFDELSGRVGEQKMPFADFKARKKHGPIAPPFALDSIRKPLLLLPIVPLPSLNNLPEDFGLATPNRTVDTLYYEGQRKLKIGGRIRVRLDESLPRNVIVVYKTPSANLYATFRNNRIILANANDCDGEVVDVAINIANFKNVEALRCAELFGAEKER